MKVRRLFACLVCLWVASLSAHATGDQSTARPPHANAGLVFDGSIIDAIAFFKPHDEGNGRSCATCHRPEDQFGLTPATVEARYQALQKRRLEDPAADDPLFRSIDADDFDQDFTTLRTKALVRVRLPLAPNVTLADDPTARSVTVFRAVPTVANTRITAPFQAEGRLGTLPEQARSAIREHSEVTHDPSNSVLRRLARFQEHLFSSARVRPIAVLKPGSVRDISRMVRFAARHGLRVAVRGHGHAVYGQTQVEGGIVIDMSTLTGVHVAHGRATAYAGSNWRSVLESTLQEGLTPSVLPDYLGLSVGGTLSIGGVSTTTHRYGAQVDRWRS